MNFIADPIRLWLPARVEFCWEKACRMFEPLDATQVDPPTISVPSGPALGIDLCDAEVGQQNRRGRTE